MQKQYDDYVCQEVVPFVRHHCQIGDIGVWTMGASLGGYHAANTLFKHPDMVKRCYALSGVYDMKQLHGRRLRRQLLFQQSSRLPRQPVGSLDAGTACDLRDSSGDRLGAVGEERRVVPACRRMLASRGIRHHLDDWGPMGGHDWPYWQHQMREYLVRGARSRRPSGIAARCLGDAAQLVSVVLVVVQAEPIHQVPAAADHLFLVDPDVALRA